MERTWFSGEVRAVGDKENIIEGYGALFGVRSVDMGFYEVIERGAFDKADLSDIRMLNDHLNHQILARTKSGTLKINVDERGLFYSGQVADTSFGRDLLVSVRRGDVDQSSFGFNIPNDGDEWEVAPDGTMLRHIVRFNQILDVSPTAFPAYPQTKN